MTIRLLLVWSCAAVIGVMGVQAWSIGQEKADHSAERTLVLHPIGVVQSPMTNADCLGGRISAGSSGPGRVFAHSSAVVV